MRFRWPNSSRVYSYALAVVLVAAAAVFTHLLSDIGDSGITPLFFAAVLLSAWYGGLGPGLLATLLSGVATAYLLRTPHDNTFAAIRDHLLRLAVFTIISLLTGSLHSAIKRAALESRRAREAAESASAAKSRFLAMVSHELRTPLTPILMIAEMLEQETSLPPKLKQDIRTLRRNVDLEIRLIEDLVDLTRINVGKMRLREEKLDAHQPLRAAIQVLEPDLRDKQLDLSIDLAASQTCVAGDPVRLQQVFWNLLRNALKFTPAGGHISVRTNNDAEQRIIIEISDTGIGIDPQRLSSIFEAFEQGEADIQVRFGGLGLGLAICQALVAAHHGSITASSAGRERGATFIVTLPVATSTQAVEEHRPVRLPQPSQSAAATE